MHVCCMCGEGVQLHSTNISYPISIFMCMCKKVQFSDVHIIICDSKSSDAMIYVVIHYDLKCSCPRQTHKKMNKIDTDNRRSSVLPRMKLCDAKILFNQIQMY